MEYTNGGFGWIDLPEDSAQLCAKEIITKDEFNCCNYSIERQKTLVEDLLRQVLFMLSYNHDKNLDYIDMTVHHPRENKAWIEYYEDGVPSGWQKISDFNVEEIVKILYDQDMTLSRGNYSFYCYYFCKCFYSYKCKCKQDKTKEKSTQTYETK